MEKTSIIIPTMRGREKMLARLISTIPAECEVIVVDDEDLLLAAKRNKGAQKAIGDYLLFIDDDNYLSRDAVENLLQVCQCSDVGAAGMTACYHDDPRKIADGGSVRNYLTGFTRGINTNKYIEQISLVPYEVDEVANSFMIKRSLFDQIGGFDEENFPIDLDEADICKRLKNLGYDIVMYPRAVCWHNSQTYSHIPNFRRPLNAYCMGNHRIRYQRKHLNALSYWVYLVIFMPVFVSFYTFSLIWKRNPKMIKPFIHGVIDGIFNRRTNQYQKR